MGVYLKGLTEDGFKEISWECVYLALKRQGRIVEVKEPHGRLIDADALTKTSGVTIQIIGEENARVVAEAFESIYQDIEDAPTVIEAEEAKK